DHAPMPAPGRSERCSRTGVCNKAREHALSLMARFASSARSYASSVLRERVFLAGARARLTGAGAGSAGGGSGAVGWALAPTGAVFLLARLRAVLRGAVGAALLDGSGARVSGDAE